MREDQGLLNASKERITDTGLGTRLLERRSRATSIFLDTEERSQVNK
jgi:hypothetical protein